MRTTACTLIHIFAGPAGPCNSLAGQSDGKVLMGGEFSTVNGVPSAYIARLWGNADIPDQIKSINRS